MTMVVEPPSPSPLVAWIWRIDAPRGAGVLAHFFPMPLSKDLKSKLGLSAGDNGGQN